MSARRDMAEAGVVPSPTSQETNGNGGQSRTLRAAGMEM